jgi:hypothetical protein
MSRPKAQISEKQVMTLIGKGWHLVDIAEFLGHDEKTIRNHFPGILTKGKAGVRGRIRETQLEVAEKGNVGMLIWLGKQLLGQSDTSLNEHVENALKETNTTVEELLELIRRKDQVLADSKKKTFEEFVAAAAYPRPFEKQMDMVRFCLDETVTRLLLGARGYGKTDYAVILAIAFDIYLHPELSTNLILTKSRVRNAAIIREIQEACERNGVTFAIANQTELRTFALTGKDNSVSAVTIKTASLRGRHPKRAIMDDPVTEDDTAEASRLLAKKKYNELMKLVSNVLLIGQPAHQYDLYAELRGVVKTLELPHGTIPELDHDLEAQRLAGVDEASISASYHLKVLSEGTSPFNAVKYLEAGQWPAQNHSVAFIDPSEGGDYTAMTILKAYMGGVAVVGFAIKKAWNHALDELIPQMRKYGVAKLFFETNCTGEMPIGMLRDLPQLAGIGVVGHRANTNKHSRIMSAGAFAHLIHLSKESSKTYLDHVVKYEYKAKFDDAPDSLASLLERVGLIRGKE